MSGSTLYNDQIVVRFKPNSQLYPYVRIECPKGADFDSVEELDKFIEVLLMARGLLAKELIPSSKCY